MRAVLVAIEASAERLSTHRGRLTGEQLDDLTRSLAQDVRRVRLLLKERDAAVDASDLADPSGPRVASTLEPGVGTPCSVVRPASCQCAPHRGVRLSSCESR